MKVTYTDAAKLELIEFQLRQKSLLEQLVSDRKLVYGDDALEITASDIKEAAQCIQPIRPTVRRYQSSEFITRVYVIIGITMMIGAFFYPRIQEILENNRTQALVFFMGATITAVGGLFGYWLKLRQRRLVDQFNKFYFFEASRFKSAERQNSEASQDETQ